MLIIAIFHAFSGLCHVVTSARRAVYFGRMYIFEMRLIISFSTYIFDIADIASKMISLGFLPIIFTVTWLSFAHIWLFHCHNAINLLYRAYFYFLSISTSASISISRLHYFCYRHKATAFRFSSYDFYIIGSLYTYIYSIDIQCRKLPCKWAQIDDIYMAHCKFHAGFRHILSLNVFAYFLYVSIRLAYSLLRQCLNIGVVMLVFIYCLIKLSIVSSGEMMMRYAFSAFIIMHLHYDIWLIGFIADLAFANAIYCSYT